MARTKSNTPYVRRTPNHRPIGKSLHILAISEHQQRIEDCKQRYLQCKEKYNKKIEKLRNPTPRLSEDEKRAKRREQQRMYRMRRRQAANPEQTRRTVNPRTETRQQRAQRIKAKLLSKRRQVFLEALENN